MNGQSETELKSNRKLAIGLLLLRLGVGVVFAMWSIDKFVNPEHASAVFEKFYKLPGLSNSIAYGIGVIQSTIVLLFLAGAFKSVTYFVILVLHAISTVSSYNQYLDPWTSPNLLFFAAFPMLAACITLWLLREQDTLCSFDQLRNKREKGPAFHAARHV